MWFVHIPLSPEGAGRKSPWASPPLTVCVCVCINWREHPKTPCSSAMHSSKVALRMGFTCEKRFPFVCIKKNNLSNRMGLTSWASFLPITWLSFDVWASLNILSFNKSTLISIYLWRASFFWGPGIFLLSCFKPLLVPLNRKTFAEFASVLMCFNYTKRRPGV